MFGRNCGGVSSLLFALLLVIGSSCGSDDDSGEVDDSWISYFSISSSSEVQLYVDQYGKYNIIRFPATPDIVGELTRQQFGQIKAVMTDSLFEIYAQDSHGSADGAEDCRLDGEIDHIVSILWLQTRVGGDGGFGCWSDDVAAPETRHMLEVFDSLLLSLLEDAR